MIHNQFVSLTAMVITMRKNMRFLLTHGHPPGGIRVALGGGHNVDLMDFNGDLMVMYGDLMVMYGDLMVIYGDLMVIYGDLMGFLGIYRGYNGIYHLVMTFTVCHGKIHHAINR